MPRNVTRGFSDTAKSGREGALRGAPAIGSPAAGVRLTEASSFDWLDQISNLADNATGVINGIKGSNDPKPAASVQTPRTAIGGLNPNILYIAGAVVLVILVVMFKRK